jgi:hypothetical protein
VAEGELPPGARSKGQGGLREVAGVEDSSLEAQHRDADMLAHRRAGNQEKRKTRATQQDSAPHRSSPLLAPAGTDILARTVPQERRMTNPAASSAVLIALMLFALARISAQSLDPIDRAAATRICRHEQLQLNRVVRVLARTRTGTIHGSFVGPLERCGNGVLILGLYPGQVIPDYQIPAGAIRRVWVRGTHGTIGLIAGTVSGATLGGAIASFRTRPCVVGTPPVQTFCNGDIARSAVISGVVGGVIGWVLGRGLPRWARVFARG